MPITNKDDLFRRIDEIRIRAEVEERTENQTVFLISRWLRSQGEDKLAVGVEAMEWYPDQWRDESGKPRK